MHSVPRASNSVGRWAAVRDGHALFSGGLRNVFSLADLKMARLLDTFDEWAQAHRARRRVGSARTLRADPAYPASTRLQLDLRSGEIRTDRVGDRIPARLHAGSTCRSSMKRDGCATTAASCDSPGLYALGLPVLRRRKSTFIHGIEDDARDVIDHLTGDLTTRR